MGTPKPLSAPAFAPAATSRPQSLGPSSATPFQMFAQQPVSSADAPTQPQGPPQPQPDPTAHMQSQPPAVGMASAAADPSAPAAAEASQPAPANSVPQSPSAAEAPQPVTASQGPLQPASALQGSNGSDAAEPAQGQPDGPSTGSEQDGAAGKDKA